MTRICETCADEFIPVHEEDALCPDCCAILCQKKSASVSRQDHYLRTTGLPPPDERPKATGVDDASIMEHNIQGPDRRVTGKRLQTRRSTTPRLLGDDDASWDNTVRALEEDR